MHFVNSDEESKIEVMKRGFTLIEALAVVSIIGILATTAAYAYTSATSRSRDARRKSDLTAISLGFQARHDALACSNQSDVGRYPGYKLDSWSSLEQRWKDITALSNTSDPCGAFSEYLLTIPTDPMIGNGGDVYRFDLSNQDDGIGKHYRLTAKLEKTLNSSESNELARARYVWENSFGGIENAFPDGYNYIIGN